MIWKSIQLDGSRLYCMKLVKRAVSRRYLGGRNTLGAKSGQLGEYERMRGDGRLPWRQTTLSED